jgi:transcriptional regulator with XRE-family HTH domain
MEFSEVIRERRAELGMSQRDLATAAGVDVRQIRRYEAGEQQPLLTVAAAIADALGISVGELAGKPSHRVKLAGRWWAFWQTFRDGEQKIAVQQIEIKQEGDLLQVANVNLGLPEDEGGYYWSGELRLWDNEVLMGWYAATSGTVRSKGTMYFVLHPHGLNMTGRWVGLGYDDRIMTGWAAFGQTREETEAAMKSLLDSDKAPADA